jgi:hypothetical protein
VTLVHHFTTPRQINAYRRTLTGEVFGWVIYPSKLAFSPTQRVQYDPEVGPVIIIEVQDGWDVFDIGEETKVYPTDSMATAVFFKD